MRATIAAVALLLAAACGREAPRPAPGIDPVLGETAIVSNVADDARGRVSAMQSVCVQLGMAVGYGIAGPLVDLIGARATNLVIAALTLSFLATWIGPWLAGRRTLAPALVES